ncbi:MAG: hypothetical protein IJ032_02830 [Clostridia bacterium]|nr:hypothetical protein [Clostridia bacterium]
MAKSKHFVYRKTIWKNVGGGLSYGGQSKLCNVGGHKLLVERSKRLDKYGNPVHTVSVLDRDGSIVAFARSNGSATLTASKALKKVGIETKYPKPWYEKKKRK